KTRELREELKETLDENQPITIFTDGSLTNDHSLKSAIIILQNDNIIKKVKLKINGIKQSSTAAELTAVIYAIDIIPGDDYQCEIFTDSKCTIDIIKNLQNEKQMKIHKSKFKTLIKYSQKYLTEKLQQTT